MTIDIPKPYETAFLLISIGLGALCVLWLISSVLRALHKRAYNLTKVETDGRGVDLSFTRVDHAARSAAIERGAAYTGPASAEQEAAAVEKERRLNAAGMFARTGALVLALANVALGVLTAYSTAEDAQANLERIDSISAVVSRFKFGFILTAVVLVAEFSRFARRNRFLSNPNPK